MNVNQSIIISVMKKISTLIAFIVCCMMAFGQGVHFEDLTLDEALAKAKAENKLVFMDCYTSWCGPCKWMATEIFPQKEAGDYFNPKFISVKYDMEKGEGLKLKDKYKPSGYPTFLIIRPDGSIQHKMCGGRNLEATIARMEVGLNEKTCLDYLNQTYAQGKMDKMQLIRYFLVLQEAGEGEMGAKVEKELDATLSDAEKCTKEYWPLIRWAKYGSDKFYFVLKYVDAYRKNVGKEVVDESLSATFYSTISNSGHGYTREQQTQLLKQVRQDLGKVDLADKEELIRNIDILEAGFAQDVKKVISFARQASDKNIWVLMQAIEAVQEKATKAELKQIMALSGQMIATADEGTREYVKEFFDELKKAEK